MMRAAERKKCYEVLNAEVEGWVRYIWQAVEVVAWHIECSLPYRIRH